MAVKGLGGRIRLPAGELCRLQRLEERVGHGAQPDGGRACGQSQDQCGQGSLNLSRSKMKEWEGLISPHPTHSHGEMQIY